MSLEGEQFMQIIQKNFGQYGMLNKHKMLSNMHEAKALHNTFVTILQIKLRIL